MYFEGMHKTSFVDYPGRMATVLFTGGCNFRCPYCHNGHLVQQQTSEHFREDAVLSYLRKRRGIIEAVVISGGEPTIWGTELVNFLSQLRGEGFFVKLDTNGTNPNLLRQMFKMNLLNYVAMDIKAPLEKYEEIVQVHIEPEVIKQSIQLIKASGIDYEFRTTVCQELLTKDDLLKISEEIAPYQRYFLQNFNDGETVLGGKGKFTPYDTLDDLKEKIPISIR